MRLRRRLCRRTFGRPVLEMGYGKRKKGFLYVVESTVGIAVGDDLDCCVCSVFNVEG